MICFAVFAKFFKTNFYSTFLNQFCLLSRILGDTYRYKTFRNKMVNKAKGAIKNAFSFLSSRKGAVQGVSTVAVVPGINQLIEFSAFKCPCVMETDLNLTCALYWSSFCPTKDKAKYNYGTCFFFVLLLLCFCLG